MFWVDLITMILVLSLVGKLLICLICLFIFDGFVLMRRWFGGY